VAHKHGPRRPVRVDWVLVLVLVAAAFAFGVWSAALYIQAPCS
jgi:hypothetical protein